MKKEQGEKAKEAAPVKREKVKEEAPVKNDVIVLAESSQEEEAENSQPNAGGV